MSKSKEYKAIKNFLHNELQISKEMIVDIVKDELEPLLLKTLRNTYGTHDMRSIIRCLLKEEIVGNRYSFYGALEHEVNKILAELLKEEFEVSIVRKTKSK
ncbi:MAG TPA: hypothetical protein DHU85_03805 [Porphyromonadaceae bacterium]|jgi:hypothetical protein|nr:hypothetical protein [Porphyromonadaceae bacterium]